ncbi:hypothetical protein AGMMS4952_27330 [Spirochaetia bacterium]|nr:hypothetical protein AGMMS4952_27330 [Spirochaetia bacterium]
MITITDVSNDTQRYWEVVDTTGNQSPEKIIYGDSADRDRARRQIVELRKAAGYIDTGWQKGKEGSVYTLAPGKNPTTTPAIEGQRLDDIENWLKTGFVKLDKKICCVTIISIVGSIASIISLFMQIPWR